MIKPVLILSVCYSRLALRGKLFPAEAGFAARRPCCSIFKLFGPLDIQTFRAARYSKFSGRWIFKVCGLLDIQSFRAARYSIFRADRYSKYSGYSIFNFFELLDIQSFRAARYSNFLGWSIFKAFPAGRYSKLSV